MDADQPMTRRALREAERARQRAHTPDPLHTPDPVHGPEPAQEPAAAEPGGDLVADPGVPAVPRGGRNLPAAITVAVVLIGCVGAGLFLPFGSPARPWGFVALVIVACVLGVWEFTQAVKTKGIHVAALPIAVGAVGIIISAFTSGLEALVVAFLLTAGAAFIWRLLDGGGPTAMRDASVSILAAAYVPFLAGFIAVMLNQTNGPWRVAVLIALAVANDTGGYIAGVFLGKHPMAPSVSPKKSWEGFAGSIVLTTAVAVPATMFLLEGNLIIGIGLGLLAVGSATMGDLIESLIKRDLGVKDMGSLLPGHGGVLDRVDSILVTAPVIFTAMWLTLGA